MQPKFAPPRFERASLARPVRASVFLASDRAALQSNRPAPRPGAFDDRGTKEPSVPPSDLTRRLSAALLLAYGGAIGEARAQSASTYVSSCRHVGVAGKTLFADCRRADGKFKQTALPIAGIENANGALRFTSMYQASTFQDSCKDINVAASTLVATCRRADGGFARTSIAIPGIENVDGDLRYRH
jgi:hypothetical protein